MMVYLPLMLASLIIIFIIVMHNVRPKFRYFWFIAIGGSLSILISLIGWLNELPLKFSLTFSNDQLFRVFSPMWNVNDLTLPVAFSLSVLTIAALLTAVVRNVSDPVDWASILLFTLFGILAILSGNLSALVICWVSIDLLEVITFIRYCKAGKSNDIVVGLSIKFIGILLSIWSVIICFTSGLPITLESIPGNIGRLLIAISVFRIGFLPLSLPVNESDYSKGVFTVSRIITASSGLMLLVYFPTNLIKPSSLPLSILILGFLILVTSFAWLFTKNELIGKSYLFLSFGLLILISVIDGKIERGFLVLSTMILLSGLSSLYFIRNKKNIWIPLVSLWGLSTLPFSMTSGIFPYSSTISTSFYVPAIIGYSVLMVGFVKDLTSRISDTRTTQQPKWVSIMYNFGLLVILLMIISIGSFYGFKYQIKYLNWINFVPLGLAIGFFLVYGRFKRSIEGINISSPINLINPFPGLVWGFYNFFRRITTGINFILEGDGGMLWSLVIFVLFITILTQG